MNNLACHDLQAALPDLSDDINQLKSLSFEMGAAGEDRLVVLQGKLDSAEAAWHALHQIELDRRPGQSFLSFMQREFPRAKEASIDEIRRLTTRAVAHSPGLAYDSGRAVEAPYSLIAKLFSEIHSFADWLEAQNQLIGAERLLQASSES